jgi:hypothetical protein
VIPFVAEYEYGVVCTCGDYVGRPPEKGLRMCGKCGREWNKKQETAVRQRRDTWFGKIYWEKKEELKLV